MTFTRYFAPAAAWLALLPAAALAECPTADDLQTGILFHIDGGDTETFRAVQPGVVEAFYKAPDGYASRLLLGQGVYLLEVVDFNGAVPDPASRTTYSYPLNPQEMPTPVPGGGWTVQAVSLLGGSTTQETQQISFGGLTQYTVGACTYDMIPIRTTYGTGADAESDLLHYFPALGLSYMAEYSDAEGTDKYLYVSVEAVK